MAKKEPYSLHTCAELVHFFAGAWRKKCVEAHLRGGRQRYHPPRPSWPAEMSGRSQRKRDNQRYGYSLYKCVSLFWCQQRVRCNCVTFGDNKMLSHSRPVARLLTGAIIGVGVCVWEVIPYMCGVRVCVCACLQAFVGIYGNLCSPAHLWRPSFMCAYVWVCVGKWKHGSLTALI